MKTHHINPITVRLLPSRIMLLLLVGAGLFFSTVLLLVPLPNFLRFSILGLIVANTLYFSGRDALLVFPWSYTSLSINTKNELKLVCKNGKQLDVNVQESTVVTAYLTVLNCRLEQATFFQNLMLKHLVILPDAVDVEDYRRLRVWLRWSKRNDVKI